MAGLVPSLILRMNVRLSNIELASTCTLSLLCHCYVKGMSMMSKYSVLFPAHYVILET